MKTDLKITGVLPNNNQECLEVHSLINEKVKKEGIVKPRILISLDTGTAYVYEMEKKQFPEGGYTA